MTFDFKNATQEQLKAEYKKIATEMGDDQFFTKKELAHLPTVLSEGEQVLAFASGLMSGNTWLITLTNSRLIFLDKGLLYGLKQTVIDLEKINSVSCKTGMIFGEITIHDSGRDHVISNILKKTVVIFTNKVRDTMQLVKNQAASTSSPIHTDENDFISKLERLAVLRDKGVLNQEEFDQQKMKILNPV